MYNGRRTILYVALVFFIFLIKKKEKRKILFWVYKHDNFRKIPGAFQTEVSR